MPVYSNRFTVQVADERAGLLKQYNEVMATVAEAQEAAAASQAAAEEAAASAVAAASAAAFMFETREDLAAAAGDIADGQLVSVRGIYAVKDATATSTKSALYDLGLEGFRLVGDIVNSNWWLDGTAGDKSALVQAMNTYATGWYGSGSAACTLVFSGVIEIANQVTLGVTGTGVLKSFNIDAKAAIWKVIAGGNLENADICAIVVQNCTRSMIEFSQVQCNHYCGGIQVDRCPNTIFDGMNLDKFRWRGLLVRGGKSTPEVGTSAGAVFNKVTGNEWRNDEPEFADSASFVATGIRNESFDVRFIMAHIGWCGIPIHNMAGSCEFISCHPFNGNANPGEIREHAYAFINEGNSNVNVYDTYGDNGYFIDLTGGMNITGLTMLDLNSVMAEPYVRVNIDPADLDAPKGQLSDVRTSVGYYTTSQQADETDPVVILAMGQSNMRSHTDMVTSNGNNVVQNDVYIWNGTPGTVGSAFIPAAYGTFPLDINVSGDYASNLAIATANNLRQTLNRPVYVILMAASAVEIERFITPATLTANGWTASTNYTSTIFSQVAAALALVPGRGATHVDYLLWHQGEANSADSASVYANKWLAMESDFRTQGIFTNANTILVGGGLRDGHAAETMIETAWATIQSTKSNAIFTSSADIPYQGTTPHFTGAGIEEFGQRYAWSALSKPSNVPYSTSHYTGNRWRVESAAKVVHYVTSTSTPDFDFYKQGASTSAEIVYSWNAGTGQSVQARISNGNYTLQSGGTTEGFLGVKTSTKSGIGGFNGSEAINLWANGAARIRMTAGGNWQPEADNTQNLGVGPFRWAQVFAGTGTINTSDERNKQDIRDVTAAEKAVAKRLRKMMRAYRFKDAVAAKGDGARWHFGIMAQQAAQAFEAEGLDPLAYGVICYDEWAEETDGNGNVIPAGNLWGIRYDELLAFIVAAL